MACSARGSKNVILCAVGPILAGALFSLAGCSWLVSLHGRGGLCIPSSIREIAAGFLLSGRLPLNLVDEGVALSLDFPVKPRVEGRRG